MENEKTVHCGCGETATHIPLIGEAAPAFKAETTQGPIDFPKDYEGKWVVLFSHPSDFTPVCTSEFVAFANISDDLKALNTELVGLSVDSLSSHIAWLRTIREKITYQGFEGKEITFPLIADLKMEVSKKYGMLHPSSSDTKTVRAVFIIDPKGIIRTMLYYPLSTGRNMAEIKRILIALQTADKGVATPANWIPGEDVLVGAPVSMDAAEKRFDKGEEKELVCQDWFFCFKKDPGHK